MTLFELAAWVAGHPQQILNALLILMIGAIPIEILLAELTRYLPRESRYKPNILLRLIDLVLYGGLLLLALWIMVPERFFGIIQISSIFLVGIALRLLFANVAAGILLRVFGVQVTLEGKIDKYGILKSQVEQKGEISGEANSYLFEQYWRARRGWKGT